jgi:hypothetical protein
MDGPQATPGVSPTGLPFGYLASSPAQLLELAKRELEHDREAAKAEVEHYLLVGRHPRISHSGMSSVGIEDGVDRKRRDVHLRARPSDSRGHNKQSPTRAVG